MPICNHCKQQILIEDRFLSAEDVLQKICEFFRINYGALIKKDRKRELVEIRMYCAQVLYHDSSLGMTLSGIGQLLGKKDHTTIIHLLKKCEVLLSVYPEIKDKLENLHNFIYGHTNNIKF
jgi:chromosomal replication initiator protein